MYSNNAIDRKLAGMNLKVGEKIGTTDWIDVTQESINVFAGVTRDMDPLHIDPVSAEKGPFGKPIAFGFYTLSMLTYFSHELTKWEENAAAGLNYGFDKIRFLTPVYVGTRLRAHFTLKNVSMKEKGALFTYGVEVEVEGEDTPALVAEWLTMLVD